MILGDQLKTGISKVRWCDPNNGTYSFRPAVMKKIMIDETAKEMSWFDELFHGGIVLPENDPQKPRAVTLLVTGPPGTGKSTLAMELCVRLTEHRDNQSILAGKTLYVTSEGYPRWMVKNAESFGWLGEVPKPDDSPRIRQRKEREIEAKAKEIFNLDPRISGRISLCTPSDLPSGIKSSFNAILELFGATRVEHGETDAIDVLVIDSLNNVPAKEKDQSFEAFYERFVASGPRLIVFILDSSPERPVAETWEFVADIVLRLDKDYTTGYMIRTIEVVKARHQGHVWGKNQLKIVEGAKKGNSLAKNAPSEAIEERLRAHPWGEGGIFIFPSIHYILSRFKRGAPFRPTEETVPTALDSLTRFLGGGLPAGYTTAILGTRGAHKSHLGHLQALYNVRVSKGRSIIISLRDDEAMVKKTLIGFIREHWESDERRAKGLLDSCLREGRLEILNYTPGYVTPEEFFHRMLLSICRMRECDKDCKIMLLFNSLDQIASRFPLCAQERVFIPGIIETLSSLGVTSVFVAADTERPDEGLRNLLSMAELIVRVKRISNFRKDRLKEILKNADEASLRTDLEEEQVTKAWNEIPEFLAVSQLTIERYAGGRPAGMQGMLELVAEGTLLSGLLRPGLQFIPYRPPVSQPGRV